MGKELLHPRAPGCYLCRGCHYVPPGENASKAVTFIFYLCVSLCVCVLFECITYDAHKLLRDFMHACICV